MWGQQVSWNLEIVVERKPRVTRFSRHESIQTHLSVNDISSSRCRAPSCLHQFTKFLAIQVQDSEWEVSWPLWGRCGCHASLQEDALAKTRCRNIRQPYSFSIKSPGRGSFREISLHNLQGIPFLLLVFRFEAGSTSQGCIRSKLMDWCKCTIF